MEINEMKSRLDRFKLFGRTDGTASGAHRKGAASDAYHHNGNHDKQAITIEKKYMKEVRRQLRSTSFTVLHQAYLDGFECDVIITSASNNYYSRSCSSCSSRSSVVDHHHHHIIIDGWM